MPKRSLQWLYFFQKSARIRLNLRRTLTQQSLKRLLKRLNGWSNCLKRRRSFQQISRNQLNNQALCDKHGAFLLSETR
nr:MAG TPA: hypothetical protein [Caudoviricetes sp.]